MGYEHGMHGNITPPLLPHSLCPPLLPNSHSAPSRPKVRHFFKVGQPRGQGKAAMLCLAQQLAEQLPGFAELLAAAVDAQQPKGGISALSMREAFDR